MNIPRYRGRFAPSPTGPLHLGSLLTALASWLVARYHHGDWLLRIEDIDPPREVPGAAQAQIETLKAFGMESDETVLWQSRRSESYAIALDRLRAIDAVFPCACSRRQLNGHPHTGRCVPPTVDKRYAWRVAVSSTEICFDDALQGLQRFPMATLGDFVVYRVEGLYAYQLAAVVDDDFQRVTDVVRGVDLLDSTPRQILLQRLLGLSTPGYTHLPVLLGADGSKLSKSLAALPVDADDPLPALLTALDMLGLSRDAVRATTPTRILARALAAFHPDLLPCGTVLTTP